MFRKVIVILAALSLAALPVYAKSAKAAAKAESAKATPGGRIANETAEAVADVLTGKDSSSKKEGNLPPGLAKKDKTPPGWDKGKKEGWDKDTHHKDSPIDVIVKSIFGGSKKSEKK